MLVIIGRNVSFVFWVARIGLVAKSAGERAQSGTCRFSLDDRKGS